MIELSPIYLVDRMSESLGYMSQSGCYYRVEYVGSSESFIQNFYSDTFENALMFCNSVGLFNSQGFFRRTGVFSIFKIDYKIDSYVNSSDLKLLESLLTIINDVLVDVVKVDNIISI